MSWLSKLVDALHLVRVVALALAAMAGAATGVAVERERAQEELADAYHLLALKPCASLWNNPPLDP